MYDFDEAAFWLEPDFVLADLVATLVNELELPIGITLFMKGMVVSGVLVSETEYLQSLTDAFNRIAKTSLRATNGNGEPPDDLFDFTMLTEGESITEMMEDSDDEDFQLPPPIRHLHMREVHILTPNPSLSFMQSLMPIMRIRMNTIDGWILGQAMDTTDDNNGNESSEILH